MLGLHRRIQRRLPAYQRGESPLPRRAGSRATWPAGSDCRAEHEALARFAARLKAHDPAAPVDPARASSLLPSLRGALAAGRRPAAAPVRRPALALAAAAVLFALGCLAGAQLFPRQVVHETIREVRVPAPAPAPVVVRVPVVVEKRIEVPVERVVTKWRTRTVVETRVVNHHPPAAPTPTSTPTPARGPLPRVIEPIRMDPRTVYPQVAMTPGHLAMRPASVDF